MQLTVQHFMWLLRAGALTYARSFDHPGSVYVVRGAPSAIEVQPAFMPASFYASDRRDLERWNAIRDLRIARALDNIAKAGGLTAHTKLWLHDRLNDLAKQRSV